MSYAIGKPVTMDRTEVRLNNSLPGTPAVAGGWLVFKPSPSQFAVGENLVGILVKARAAAAAPMTGQKIEVHLAYR